MSDARSAAQETLGDAGAGGRPSGTLTFLFTDIEGSSRLWALASAPMAVALERHDGAVRGAIGPRGGVVFATGGDGFAAAFSRATDAIAAAEDAQAALRGIEWPGGLELRVRMGLHSGEAVERGGDYFGPSVNLAARLMALAHAGQIICSSATAALVGSAAHLEDLGEHRLRDVSSPVRVFQLGRERFPPLKAAEAPQSNLSVPLTSFVGRDEELHDVMAALAASHLVTLVGVGGMGKTRLAVHVASNVGNRFADGVFLVELGAVDGSEGVADLVAVTLGVIRRTGMTLAESIVEQLRTRVFLLVLDNCEHVLDAAASLASLVLGACPDVRLLATSREALAIDGEQLWPVRPLGLPTSADDRDAASVRLFVDRARLVDPSFSPDVAAVGAIIEICTRLDGMPLAIELAASRVASMSPHEIAQLLSERFRLLTGGRRNAVERHQSLRAAVEWSYGLLSAREQNVFIRLSVFAGSFDAADAVAVLADDTLDEWAVREALASLVTKSLLSVVDAPAVTTRFQLAETLRAFARERLDREDDSDWWRHRHAQHFSSFAKDAAAALQRADELVWWPRLEAALDNLRAAVMWALDHRDSGHLAVEMITDLGYVPMSELRFGIGAWAEQALELAADAPPGRRASLYSIAAYHAGQSGKAPAGERALAERAIADGIPADCPSPGLLYMPLAVGVFVEGRAGDAVEIAVTGAVATAAAGYGAYHRSVACNTAAAIASAAGDVEAATQHAELGLSYARAAGCPSAIGSALAQLGWSIATAEPRRAHEALTEAVSLAERGARLPAYDQTLVVLARLDALQSDRDSAARYARAAFVETHRQGDRRLMIPAIRATLVVVAWLGDLELATTLLGGTSSADYVTNTGRFLLPRGEVELEEIAAQAREALGDSGFEDAFLRGAAMDVDELAIHAIAVLDDRHMSAM